MFFLDTPRGPFDDKFMSFIHVIDCSIHVVPVVLWRPVDALRALGGSQG
jgi:hypothetical protein